MHNAQVPDYIRSMIPYAPGKPIEETQREYGLKKVVKLASNENPLGPSPKAVLAVKKCLLDQHRYPDGSAFGLKKALSKKLKFEMSQITIGNGSNEIIDLLIRAYCVPGDSIVTSQAAFICYKLCAQIHGVTTVETPLTADLCFDLKKVLHEVVSNQRARMVFIANPNNPTGTYVPHSELDDFLKEVAEVRGGSVLVVLDYAYWEYVTAKDLSDPDDLIRKYPNVVVLRTFSKIHGLAGFRIGYGVGQPDIMQNVEKVRQPFNANAMALVAAEAALADSAFVKKARALNTAGLKLWKKALTKLEVPFWETQGNFILADSRAGFGMTGVELYQYCLKKGLILRPVANYGMPHAIRISVGTEAENKFSIKILEQLKKSESSR